MYVKEGVYIPPSVVTPHSCVDNVFNCDVENVTSALNYDFGAENPVEGFGLLDSGTENFEPNSDFYQEIETVTSDAEGQQIFDVSTPEGTRIEVFSSCVKGSCKCIYRLDNVESQLKPCRFASLILSVPGYSEKYLQLLWHITDGFPIVDSDVDSYKCVNYSSITCPEVSPVMDKIIGKELAEGAISISDVKPKCIHALGAVSKPDGGIRPITDCSRPVNLSVNFNCDSLLEDFCFKSVANVTEVLNRFDYMSVVDIKSAYRAVPIHPQHRKFQGFSWFWEGEQRWFVENRMCFGLRLGPMYFNLISTFIYDVLTDIYDLEIVNYLDDFISVSRNYVSAVTAQATMIRLLRYCGFHVSFSKIVHPAQCATYLGIVIDSDRMELRLPEGKVSK